MMIKTDKSRQKCLCGAFWAFNDLSVGLHFIFRVEKVCCLQSDVGRNGFSIPEGVARVFMLARARVRLSKHEWDSTIIATSTPTGNKFHTG